MADIKRKPGRPPLKEGEGRIRLQISLSPSEGEKIDKIVAEMGATRSGFIRRACLMAIEDWERRKAQS